MKTESRTVRAICIGLLLAAGLVLGGCAHVEKPKPESSDYTPVKDRPLGSTEYWKERTAQDRAERVIERAREPR